jgi:subtilase family serine protease
MHSIPNHGLETQGEKDMRRHHIGPVIGLFASLLTGFGIPAQAQGRPANHGSPISQATDLGPLQRSSPVAVTLWLKPHNMAALKDAADSQRAGQTAWLSGEEFQAQHAPTAADVAAVSGFLKNRGFTVSEVGPNNFYVKAVGAAGTVQTAFGVELHQYKLNDQTFHGSTAHARLPAAIAPLVAAVGGLTNLAARPMHVRPSDVEGVARKPMPLNAQSNGLIFSAQCFLPPTSEQFSSADAHATYSGNRYGQSITNSSPGTVAPCGYQPSDLYKAYNLNPLYRAGLDGTGETIAIVDAFGSITIQQDAAAFSAAMGLPAPHLTVIGKPTGSNFDPDTNIAGWATETTLDVEWVHAIAPGAKIVLVVAADDSFDNLIGAIAVAAAQRGVVTISNSWGSTELGTDPEFRSGIDDLFAAIGAQGIAVNFSSGDSGDESINLGVASADWPASSPLVTAIGGVSVGLSPNKQISFQTSWGNNLTEVADTIALGSPPIDPPNNEGFDFGGGGGASDVYAQPRFQRGLPGDRRLVPDISWVADPFTGVEIIFTGDAAGDQFIEVIGGTSVACPMFSALWGIATQAAGRPLGQAAPHLYKLPPDAITDVRAAESNNNVTGIILDAGGTAFESAGQLAAPLQNLPSFYSALYNSPFSTRWFVITFGTDSTLEAGPGYDTATGLGTPNGANFVRAFARH